MYIIKQLRRKNNLSQSQLGKEIGVSLRTIQLYERKDANIPIKNLTKIAEYFGLTIAELYMHEVNDMGEAYTKRQPFTKHGSVFYPLEYGKYLVMAPLVLVEWHQKYIRDIAKDIFSNPFQGGFIIDFLTDEAHRIFEVSGDSMDDGTSEAIPNKAYVLGLEIKKESLTRNNETYWKQPYILVCSDRIICKQLTGFDRVHKSLLCHNLNTSPEFQDFELPLDEVLQVFKVVKKQL
ncbi:helix-turn-helix domain-containing protein [Muricauda oceani]|uniref:Helix-turn-helix domain-containing protein n=1 Tax=Flagellimonas oceani TaxID=2698672 RepID=A0A6G7J7Q4_9FLAO|nr:helix-turn-helix domain-containing protein [Allomuricauda oceani]MBW8245021.1 helix-turn-helix domain-containing protein [Allomuricauda oceani]QII46467.1 helix-turn-helix domain-containing protein [Allomuricauda oceani]